MGGIGALPAPGRHQTGVLAVLKEPVGDHSAPCVVREPGPEPGQHTGIEAGVRQLRCVKSARSAVPAFRPVRFSGPLPAPAVCLSAERALRKSLGFLEDLSHPVIGHGEGMTDPRYR